MSNRRTSRARERIEGLGLPERLGAWIDADWVAPAGGSEIAIDDPADRSIVAVTIDGEADLVDAAVTSAQRAFGIWRDTSASERATTLYRMAGQIRSNLSVLSAVESIDTGKPLREATQNVEGSARFLEYYAGLAENVVGATLPQDQHRFAYTVREPYGVVAHITPWNGPLFQMCRGVAPALAVGNTVVVKPSELAPLTTLMVGKLFDDAGLPPGAYNVVPGLGASAGTALLAHPAVRHITFTGSVATGSAVMRAAADRVVPCNLELGGKSPTLVFADADLDAAAAAGAQAVITSSGQACYATTRLLVDHRVHEEFVERLVAKVSNLSLGAGLDDPDLGPLISQGQRAKVTGFLDEARSIGIEVQQPSRLPDLDGYFVAPAILTGVTPDMRVAREEVFGPVQTVLTFEDEDEALALANDSEFGLAAGVFTSDVNRALRLVRKLEAGTVQVNRYPATGYDTPFGGYKRSGIGRQKGAAALHEYSQLKSVIFGLE